MGPGEQFFSAVRIERNEDHFLFRTAMPGQQTLETRYYPDRLVRIAEDFHFTEDGEMIRIPSHESAYCDADTIHGQEMGFLPDGTVTRETFTIKVSRQAGFHYIHFDMTINGEDVMSAFCRQAII